MKKLLVIILSGIALCSRAQTPLSSTIPIDTLNFEKKAERVKAATLNLFGSDTSNQARALKMYGREEAFWSARYASNAPDTVSKFNAINHALRRALNFGSSACLGNGFKGRWSSMGPSRDTWGGDADRQGRVTSLWVDPVDTNYILAGSSGGGLWKTLNGGKDWWNITDAAGNVLPGTMGVMDIAVNPVDKNIIYLSTGSQTPFSDMWSGKYGLGIVYSDNGGVTWAADNAFNTLVGGAITSGFGVKKLAYMRSSQKLFAIHGKRVFMKNTAGAAWTDITPPLMATVSEKYFFYDFEMTRSPEGKVVFATNCVGNTQYIMIYNTVTNTWQQRNIIIPGQKEAIEENGSNVFGIHDIALVENDDILLRTFLTNIGEPFTDINQLHKIALGTAAVSTPSPILINANMKAHRLSSGQPDGVPGQLLVNEVNPSIIYLLDVRGYSQFIYRSTNGGVTYPTVVGSTHADGRCGTIYKSSASGLNDVIFCGTDGGVAKKTEFNSQFKSLTGKGLAITQFLSLSSSPDNNRWMTAGAVDNHTQTYNKNNPSGAWAGSFSWGDGWKTKFGRNGMNNSIGRTNDRVEMFSFTGTSSSISSYSQPADQIPKIIFMNPFQIDHANNTKTGYHYIWNRPATSTTWTMNFPTEPKNYPLRSSDLVEKRPIDFIVFEKSPQVSYIAEFLPSWGNHAIEKHAKLFVTTNSGAAWLNISPPEVGGFGITDIESDPSASNRIWVALGGVDWDEIEKHPTLRTKRVKYSSNYGTTWQDFSKGLPALPIHKIVYVPGSDNILFAGTDAGVYRWNKDLLQWECFNDGLPPRCIVTDMEYLSCSGKLRVSTYGRGIYETPIVSDLPGYVPGDIYTITTNTTWSQSKTVEGNIRIKPGATLTISGASNTVFMPRNGRIYVEKGAKLVLDAARITNDCDSCHWDGIILSGNKFATPIAANQGYFEMKNGAVVENAATGVCDFDATNLQGGGIILASNSTFLNCWKAVALNDYPNYPRAATCSFNNVTFKVSNNKPMEATSGVLPPHQFTAFAERGVVIDGCTFVDERPLETGSLMTAIASTDADYKVTNTTFTHMRRGIYAEMLYSVYLIPKPTILNNTFTDVQENITMYATNPVIRGNSFYHLRADVPGAGAPPLTLKKPSWAVYLDGTRGANVVNNYINGHGYTTLNTTANRLKYGVIAKGTGQGRTYYGGKIMNNSFYNLFSGIQTERQNMNLYFNCNGFTRQTYAASINPATGGMWVAPGTNILQSQNGGCVVFFTRPNNSFSNNANGIYSWITSPAQYFTYYLNSTGPSAFIPALSGGGFSPIYCSGLGTVDANRICNLESVQVWDQTKLNFALGQYNTHKSIDALSAETWFYHGEIVRGYTQMDNLAGLKSFLLADNTDESKFQLIPIHIHEGNYQTALNTITSMSIEQAEKTGMTSYFNVMIALKQSNRRPNQLTPQELTTMNNIAGGDLDIANAAKSLLE